MKRTPFARKTPLGRGTSELQRGNGPDRTVRVKPINRKRRAKEFARAYGSSERVMAMKLSPCDGCGRVPHEDALNENAHTEGGGAGRKADFATIVTLCPDCHRLWHYLGSTEAFDGWKGTDLRATAARLAEQVRP